MKLTKEQRDWVNNEKKTLKRIIDSSPSTGMFRYVARQEALHLIIEMHNLALEMERSTEK